MIIEELGILVSVEIIGGFVQNVMLVQVGEYNFGFVIMGLVYDVFIGNSLLMFGFEYIDICVLFLMYQILLQVVVLILLGIILLEGFDGKCVGVGLVGGILGIYWLCYLVVVGLDVIISNVGGNDIVGQLKDGLIDGFLFVVGLLIGVYVQLVVENDVIFFEFLVEELVIFLMVELVLVLFIILVNIYEDQLNDFQLVLLWNFVIMNKDMDDEIVYQIVKLVMENNDCMMQNYVVVKEILLQYVINNSFMIFYFGVVCWFEENGYVIFDDLK